MNLMEVLAGVLRYFPNTMLITLLAVGLLTARLNWILVAFGGVLLSVFVLMLQYIFARSLNIGLALGSEPGMGEAVIRACSLLPIDPEGAKYSTVPSVWMALTTFFASYIITNAVNIYSLPASRTNAFIPIQQRKGLGLISVIATVFLLLFLLIPRYITGCETLGGTLLGITLGALAGWGWWELMFACSQPAWPDIHGIMIGTAPGPLRAVIGSMACAPAQK